MSTLVSNCPTKCPPVDHMDWQKPIGILRTSSAAGIDGQICNPGVPVVFNRPKRMFLIGFTVQDSATNIITIVPALNGAALTVDNNWNQAITQLSTSEYGYNAMFSGSAEEKQLFQMLNRAWCTNDFDTQEVPYSVFNNTPNILFVRPMYLDFNHWFIPS